MRDRGRLTAPGDLLNGAALAPEGDTLTEPAGGSQPLRHAFAKLGIRSRVELALIAAKRARESADTPKLT